MGPRRSRDREGPVAGWVIRGGTTADDLSRLPAALDHLGMDEARFADGPERATCPTEPGAEDRAPGGLRHEVPRTTRARGSARTALAG